jgi:hypothetical protein
MHHIAETELPELHMWGKHTEVATWNAKEVNMQCSPSKYVVVMYKCEVDLEHSSNRDNCLATTRKQSAVSPPHMYMYLFL